MMCGSFNALVRILIIVFTNCFINTENVSWVYYCVYSNDSKNTGYGDVYSQKYHIGTEAVVIDTPYRTVRVSNSNDMFNQGGF